MRQVVIPNPSSSESDFSPACSCLFNIMQGESWRWFITCPVKCLFFFFKSLNTRRECKYASSPAPQPLSSSEHVWNLTRTLAHPGRLSDSRRQGCSPCVCQRCQTPKAQRDQMGNHKPGPLPSAVCCHLIWMCIKWEGRGGQPHLWARLSQVDGFPHLACPAGLTLPFVWPPENHWLSPSSMAHRFNFSETEQALEESSGERCGAGRTGNGSSWAHELPSWLQPREASRNRGVFILGLFRHLDGCLVPAETGLSS